MIDVEKLQDDALDELRRLPPGAVIELRLRFEEAMILIANVQLALRHPENCDRPTARIVRDIADRIIKFFDAHGCPSNALLARLGYERDFDR